MNMPLHIAFLPFRVLLLAPSVRSRVTLLLYRSDDFFLRPSGSLCPSLKAFFSLITSEVAANAA